MTISEALTKAVLLPYQKNWLSDTSVVKVWEKSRRIGASYVEALSCVMKAMLSKGDGGMSVGRHRAEDERLSSVSALTSFPLGKLERKIGFDVAAFWAHVLGIACSAMEEVCHHRRGQGCFGLPNPL